MKTRWPVVLVFALLAAIAVRLATYGGDSADRRPAEPQHWKGETGRCGAPLLPEHLSESRELTHSYLVHSVDDNGLFRPAWNLANQTSARPTQLEQGMGAWGLAALAVDAEMDSAAPLQASTQRVWLSIGEATRRSADPDRSYLAFSWARYGSVEALAWTVRAGLLLPGGQERVAPLLRQVAWQVLHGSETLRYYHPDTGVPYGHPHAATDAVVLAALSEAAAVFPDDATVAAALTEQRARVTRYLPAHSTDLAHTAQFLDLGLAVLAAHAQEDEAQEHVLQHAVWLIDEHRLLQHKDLTASVVPGLLAAWRIAQERSDPREAKIACVLRLSLRRNLAFQVGHRTAKWGAAGAPLDDLRALGGVFGGRDDPELSVHTSIAQLGMVLAADSSEHAPFIGGRSPRDP
jgi:hypothetical protein